MSTSPIYKGKYLTIYYEIENSLFIQNWTISPEKGNDFKKEMLAYTALYKNHKPKHSLWLQKNFTLNIDTEIQFWIEKHINKPCYQYGNKKCAFVVSEDILAHISVIDSFDKIKSCINPKHFTTENKARKWLNNEVEVSKKIKNKILYEGIDKEGNLILKIPSQNIKSTFKSLNSLISQEKFQIDNQSKFNLLTKREKEILSFISKGKKQKEISEKLFISIHTVRTHWRNIKYKLNFENDNELLTFLNSFNF